MALKEKVEHLRRIEQKGLHEEKSWSVEDREVFDLSDRECKLNNGHYQIPIQRKKDTEVPNNNWLAISRLESLKRNLVRSDLTMMYDAKINKLIQEGYAEKFATRIYI